MNILTSLEVTFHKKGSLIDIDQYHDTMFLDIVTNQTFKGSPSIFNGETERFDASLEPLDSIFLVKNDLVGIYIKEVSAFQSLGGEFFYDLENELYDIPYWIIYEDLIPTLREMSPDRYGIIHFVVSVLFVEHGSVSYEGEYDSHFEYLGIINSGFDPTSILTKESKERYLKYQEEIHQL